MHVFLKKAYIILLSSMMRMLSVFVFVIIILLFAAKGVGCH